jgi:uncharacterized membrane protein YeaQ/YmgE (transglycosylase-associated protein family)
MTLLWTILIGFLVGLVAKLLIPGHDPGGFIITTLIGIAGSFIANYVGMAVGWYRNGETAGFIAAVLGAIVLVVAYRLVARKS